MVTTWSRQNWLFRKLAKGSYIFCVHSGSRCKVWNCTLARLAVAVRFGIISGVICYCLAGTGCKRSEVSNQSDQGASLTFVQPDPIDLSEIRSAFGNADASMKVYVDECISSIRARDFGFAAEQLEKLLKNPRLTPQQREAVQTTLARIKAKK